MSLKHFHLLFIFIAVLTCMGFGAWALLTRGLPEGFQLMGWISTVSGLVFLGYGIHFLRKMKRIIT